MYSYIIYLCYVYIYVILIICIHRCYTYVMYAYMLYLWYGFIYVILMICMHICYTYDRFSYMFYLWYVFIFVILMLCIHICYNYVMYAYMLYLCNVFIYVLLMLCIPSIIIITLGRGLLFIREITQETSCRFYHFWNKFCFKRFLAVFSALVSDIPMLIKASMFSIHSLSEPGRNSFTIASKVSSSLSHLMLSKYHSCMIHSSLLCINTKVFTIRRTTVL